MKDPNLILVEGVPGIGKTVVIAIQWAGNKLLSSRKLLLLQCLVDCRVGFTEEDMQT